MAFQGESKRFPVTSKKTEQPRIVLLEEEVRNLSEELIQCQADKEFVWSLWKRLQVANPDLTQAVSLVVEREKEKAEAKDRKVLEILQVKDGKIEHLELQATGQQQEINNLVQRKIAVDQENDQMKQELSVLQKKLEEKSQELKHIKEKAKRKEEESRLTVKNLEEEKKALDTHGSDLQNDLQKLKKQAAQWKEEKSAIESKVKLLNDEIKEAKQQTEDLQSHHNEVCSELSVLKTQVANKDDYITKLKKELQEIQNLYQKSTQHAAQQAELIQQLESLNLDAQKVLQNQEEAHTAETVSYQKLYNELSARYEALKSSETQLLQNHVSLTTQLYQKEQKINQLQVKLQQTHHCSHQPARQTNAKHLGEEVHHVSSAEVESLIAAQKADIEQLREKLKTAEVKLAAHALACNNEAGSTLQRGRTFEDSPVKRSRSLSPKSCAGELEELKRLRKYKNKIQNLEELVKLKNEENEELRQVNERRQDRLHLLQTNFRTLKEQLKEVDESHSKTKSKAPIHRVEPWQLRQEDSDAVWNELAYFKREHKKLLTEKTNLEDMLDQIKVQTATDKATIHELRLCLQQEKEELLLKLKDDTEVKSSTPKKKEEEKTEQMLNKVFNLEKKLKTVEKEAKKLKEANEQLIRSTSAFKESLARLQNAEEEKLLEIEKLQKENEAVKKELREKTNEHEKRVATLKRQLVETNELRRENREILKQVERLQLMLSDSKASAAAASAARATQGPATKQGDLKTASSKVKFKAGKHRSTQRRRQAFLNQSIKEMSRVFENFNQDGWEDISEDSESESLSKDNAISSEEVLYEEESSILPTTESEVENSTTTEARYSVVRPLYPKASKEHAERRKEKRTSCSKMSMPSAFNKEIKPKKKKAVIQNKVGWMALQQKITTLQQQIAALHTEKRVALSTTRDLKETNKKITSQLNLVNQRFQISKQVAQKLTSDLEELQRQKDKLQTKVSELKEQQAQESRSTAQQPAVTPSHSLDSATPPTKDLELEIKQLQNKLKNANNEITKHIAASKTLKADVQEKEQQLQELQEKFSRMERDISMKRQLIEDLKSRLKSSQEHDNNYKEILHDMEIKIRTLSEEALSKKVFVDSLKQRFAVATKERAHYEELFRKCKEDVDKKSHKLQDLQSKLAESEIAMKELEETASQTMHGLAQQSEQALETVHKKLTSANSQIDEFIRFVKDLIKEIHDDINSTKSQIRKNKKQQKSQGRLSKESINRAQSLAASILNICPSDLEEILDVDDEETSESAAARRKQQEWMDNVARILEGQVPFASYLMEAFQLRMKEAKMLTEELASLKAEMGKANGTAGSKLTH
ncbi:centlein [Erpetoichthys calabaricus]|uniref:Centlein n=1 Tax=Erpetoichthys calabaricus TaxID=27687 RepID=A0A8C4XIF0_ERPCA|nr:centlein [Erpetoichthys calabaricus]